MKILLAFSLKRRLTNKMNLILSALFIGLLFTLLFFDVVSDIFKLEFSQAYEIVLNDEAKEWLTNDELWTNQGFVFTQFTGNSAILKNGNQFTITGKSDLLIQTKIKELILDNHQRILLSSANESMQSWLDEYMHIEVQFENNALSENALKEQFIIVLLTSLYFMMLNFIAVNSNEIILEKTSNFLGLILSSITSFEHYISKLLSGFLTLLFQILSSSLSMSLVFLLRYQYDQGKGLFEVLTKILLIPLNDFSFKDIFVLLGLNFTDLGKFILSFIFLILGMMIVQTLVLVLSSTIKNSEEAASIQGPFYFGLLIVYYLSLSLNASEHLTQGLGYTLSFLPITSILIMPMRLVLTTVPSFEVFLSLMIQGFTLFSVMFLLFPIYKRGLQTS